MKLLRYHSPGHSWLVCPALIDHDPRHGEHYSKWPRCRQRAVCLEAHSHTPECEVCILDHDHEKVLTVPAGGHRVEDNYWLPGCRPLSPEEHPVCACGRRLVVADLDDPYDLALVVELEVEAGDPNHPRVALAWDQAFEAALRKHRK